MSVSFEGSILNFARIIARILRGRCALAPGFFILAAGLWLPSAGFAKVVPPGAYEINQLKSGDPLLIVDQEGLIHPSVFRGESSDSLYASPVSFAVDDIREIRLLPWHKALPHPKAGQGGPEWLFVDRRLDFWVGGWTSITIGSGAALGAVAGSLLAGALVGGFGGIVLFAVLFR
jgi:hypothetical protein